MKKVRIRRTRMRRAMVRRVVMRREASAESQQHNLMWESPTIALHTSSQNSADPVGSEVMEEVRGAPNEGAASKHLCQTMEPLVKATNDSHEPLSSARPGDPDSGGASRIGVDTYRDHFISNDAASLEYMVRALARSKGLFTNWYRQKGNKQAVFFRSDGAITFEDRGPSPSMRIPVQKKGVVVCRHDYFGGRRWCGTGVVGDSCNLLF